MSVISPELQTKIAYWRMRCADGSITLEEMREAMNHLRGDRRKAAELPKSKRPKKQAKTSAELLEDL